MSCVYVAAGGGGDALAAAIVHRALGADAPAVIATYAWDRLIVDPLPGPRSPADFDRLQPIGEHNFAVTSDSMTRPPAGSTLPRLAADLQDQLALLDPTHGAIGIRDQLSELVAIHDSTTVTVLDVGGDAVARGTEPGLRSPLADGLVLAACSGLAVPTDLLVAGPGLDGELSESDVLATTGTTPVLRLAAEHIEPFRHALDWHPSEATALLAGAARGLRGRVEVRDSGLVVRLTDRSPGVYRLSLADALAANKLAAQLADTASLTDAEDITRSVCGFSEIDYERAKASHLGSRQPGRITRETDDAVRAFEHEAARRGVDYVTFRRIAEAASLGPVAATDLRRHLITTRPEHDAWPLWAVTAPSVVSADR
jgi:hypothetical protein